MRNTEKCISWVVYRMTLRGKTTEMRVVCEQQEWDALELAQPGQYTLVLEGIPNEGEAEQLARRGPADVDTSKLPARKIARR